MTAIERCSVPAHSLLRVYAEGDGYADCYTTVLRGVVSHADFVTAFYTTWVFKLERLALKWLVAKPSTDADVARLAAGTSDDFAAWRVEARVQDQLLVTDFRGSTRSWLMVAPVACQKVAGQNGAGQAEAGTRLYFGSAVVARRRSSRGVLTLGWGFRLMLGFHKIYSRVLLRAARERLSAPLPAVARGERVALWIAIAVVAAYVGAGGIAKLAGVPYVHSSFPKLGLPPWFGYFIGVCEVLGPLGLLIRPLRALAALGIGIIMIGATYYHTVHTPVLQAIPAAVLTMLCVFIFMRSRTNVSNQRMDIAADG